MSIMTFNTSRVEFQTLSVMHESTERLYLAAKKLAAIEGQSAVARALNESPQVVKNWESRGVSADGAISAEMRFNCRAAWVKSGHGLMECAASAQSSADAQALATMFDQIKNPAEQDRFRGIAERYARMAIRGELIATLDAGQRAWPGREPTPAPLQSDVSQTE